ncbi:MAG: hypothetical protein F6K30_10030 [Cyanothece sp. SIO2G6]|nr:hypothetical protein [Cyanothece sp. SIO2G6]
MGSSQQNTIGDGVIRSREGDRATPLLQISPNQKKLPMPQVGRDVLSNPLHQP